MKIMRLARGLAPGIFLACGLAAEVRSEVKGPWVTTDRTVDCSSLESILRDLKLKAMKTDEEKALALFYFYRQRVFHYQNQAESRNVVKNVNCLGYTLCGSQATCMQSLLKAAGYAARVVARSDHTYYEVFYDGKWHGYDTMMTFWVRNRGDKKDIASFAELNKDPTLIGDAAKEDRACPAMCMCGDSRMGFSKPVKVLNYEPETSSWSVKDYILRPGEEIVRAWWPSGKPMPGYFNPSLGPGPLHTCGSRDSKAEPFLFKFWEPYAIRGFGSASVSYRHYANGWMAYSPPLTPDAYKEAVVSESGITAGAEGLAGKGEIVIPVKCPFLISAASIAFEATGDGADGVTVSVCPKGGQWNQVLSAKDSGRKAYQGDISAALVIPGKPLHEYQVKLALDGKAVLHHLYLKTFFMHNAMAAPHLMPGKNKISVEAVNPAALKQTPLTVIYRYKPAPAWTEEKSVEKEIKESPATFEVELPETDKLPQMQDLTIRCGALAWAPPAKTALAQPLKQTSRAVALSDWTADGPLIKISYDDNGMLLQVAQKAEYPQCYLELKRENWSEYKELVLELENLEEQAQPVAIRLRSNEKNEERTDVEQQVGKGPATLRIPLSAFNKTKLAAITRLNIMLIAVPDSGARIRVKRISLELSP